MSPHSTLPTISPQPRLSDFFQGMGLLGRAFSLILRDRRLFLLSALCAAVTAAALVGLAWLLWRYAPGALESVWTRPESWYGQAAWTAVLVLSGLVLWVVGANVLPPLLLAPLQDPLSELTEEACGGGPGASFTVAGFVRGLVTGIAHTLARLFFLLAGLAVLLPLHLIPGVGSVLWTVLASLYTMTWMAGEYLAAPMTRHLYPFAEVRRMLRERRALCLGLGAGIYVLLWVPILNAFFLPVAIVAGTLLYGGLREARLLAPPPGESTTAALK
ncbi:putative membrane protein [Myxococcus xanthus DK 1622]|uniref:Membrane protein n=2 Tax=Myxococcus xanthus TaxID=34 RepID=Q1D079_MYXXD|nr:MULTISPECIES: EI24 domain-containing protein [Myxococcus]ABF92450.1 putative membrane protein [Myxococcus xanthus DK 1622]NOJ53180.1 sulfate transporter [Myxococcus xanthus]QPM78221.1 EI24 domain-containing protein [Myxococcus xanthus]QVW67288.1 EI24 domain-containing protein [Myxococcus xanthus DZ2]QZZ53446.1 Sulfate transporter CysZ [Myxococcus xanthus]